MGALLAWLMLGQAQADELIRRLDDDSPSVRDEATRSLRRQGAGAVPALERALSHESAEVRSRAAWLLDFFPEHVAASLQKHPDYDEVRTIWNAVIDAAISKRPIPQALCRRLGLERQEVAERLVEEFEGNPGIHAEEVLDALRADGIKALHSFAGRVGIEGQPARERVLESCIERRSRKGLLMQLVRIGADADTVEEIFGTLAAIRWQGGGGSIFNLSSEDWDLSLRILVQFRRRPGAPSFVLPVSRTLVLTHVARGPWIRGIASGVRARESRKSVETFLCREKSLREVSGKGEETFLEEVYLDLSKIDAVLGEPESSALSDEGLRLLHAVCSDGDPSREERRILRELISRLNGHGWTLCDESLAAILRALARHVVLDSRAEGRDRTE